MNDILTIYTSGDGTGDETCSEGQRSLWTFSIQNQSVLFLAQFQLWWRGLGPEKKQCSDWPRPGLCLPMMHPNQSGVGIMGGPVMSSLCEVLTL